MRTATMAPRMMPELTLAWVEASRWRSHESLIPRGLLGKARGLAIV